MSRSSDNLARSLLPMLEPVRHELAASQAIEEPEIPAPAPTPSLKLRDVVREHILYVLTRTHWVIEGRNGAAALLDVKPSTLRYRMRILDIRKPPTPDPGEQVALLFRRSRPPLRT